MPGSLETVSAVYLKIPAGARTEEKGAEIRVWNPDYHIAGALHGNESRILRWWQELDSV